MPRSNINGMTHIYFQLNSIGWNGSNKMSVCPGIVELTQRFNRISFWVISVILQKQTNKIRSEVVQQFIKIAKRLHDLRKMLKIETAYAIAWGDKVERISKRYIFETCWTLA